MAHHTRQPSSSESRRQVQILSPVRSELIRRTYVIETSSSSCWQPVKQTQTPIIHPPDILSPLLAVTLAVNELRLTRQHERTGSRHHHRSDFRFDSSYHDLQRLAPNDSLFAKLVVEVIGLLHDTVWRLFISTFSCHIAIPIDQIINIAIKA